MAQRLDKDNYSAEETITIKIPFNLPYQAEGKTFERRGGEFQHDGEFYKLVKQKVENDTLYVVCIKDNKEKKIFNFMADMVKMSSDLPASSSTMKLLNSLIKDYMPSTTLMVLSQQGWSVDFTFTATTYFNILSVYSPVYSPPPEFLS